jgi:parallel beta-helix repeat protein
MVIISLVLFLITSMSTSGQNFNQVNQNFHDSVGKGIASELNLGNHKIYFLNESDNSEEIKEDEKETIEEDEKEKRFNSKHQIINVNKDKATSQRIRISNQKTGVKQSGISIKYSENTGTPRRLLGGPLDSVKQESTNKRYRNIKKTPLEVLDDNKKLLNIDIDNLKEKHEYSNDNIESHTYQQFYENIPVWSSEVGITIKDNSDIILMGSDYFDGINISVVPSYSSEGAVNDVKNKLGFNELEDRIINVSLYIFPLKNNDEVELHLAWKIDTKIKNPPSEWIYFIGAHKGDILFKYNNLRDYSEKILVQGTAKADIYPENTKDSLQTENLDDLYINFYDYDPFDADDILGSSPYLTDSSGYYKSGWIDIMTDPFGGQGEPYLKSYLRGPYVKVLNEGGSESYHYYDLNTNPLTARTYNFNFYSGQEQNVFYHLNKIHNYFEDAPFNFNGMDYQMVSTVNYGNADYCNAFYSPATGNTAFGRGDPTRNCGDLSLDSDVIYHEYTHGVVDHVYNLPYYGQSGAISEALADYYACTINGNSKQGEGTFEGGLRDLDNNKKYPDDWVGEVHYDSVIISGAFWDIRKSLGKGYTDYLIFQAMQLSPHAYDFEEFLENILLVDDDNSNLNDGTPNDMEICSSFKDHGIISSFCNQILDCNPSIESDFYSIGKGEEVVIKWNNPCDTIHTDIHYCSPGYICNVDSAEFSSIDQSGSKGDFSDKLALSEEGIWKFFVHSVVEDDYYSNIGSIDVKSKLKVKVINSLSEQVMDGDNDGLYDKLIVNVPVNVSESGMFEIDIDLRDQNNSYITGAHNLTNLNIGLKNVSVPIDGKRIRKKGVNGPYIISSVWIYDENASLINHEYINYSTSAYSFSDFQKPDLSIVDTYNSFGKDTNSNGLFEFLTITSGIKINKAGYYNVYGYLTNKSEGGCTGTLNFEEERRPINGGDHYIQNGVETRNYDLVYNNSDYCSIYSERVYLNITDNLVSFNFEGDVIRDRKLTGPLYLRYFSLIDDKDNFIESRVDPYNFTDYNYSKFEEPFECTIPSNSYNSPLIIEDNTVLCRGEYSLPKGIKIVSNNTVLDCNGAKIIGDDSTFGIYGFLNHGGNNITVKNCHLDGYNRALDVQGGNNNFYNNSINNSVTGIEIIRGNNNKAFNNRISNTNTGVWLWSENSEIFNNEISNSEKGIFFFYMHNNNNKIYNNNISSSVYTIDLNEVGSENDGVDNHIWNNNLYNSSINYQSRYSNHYCFEGVGNNYHGGASGPRCDLYCDINYEEEECNECKYPRLFIDEDTTLCKGEYYFPEGLSLRADNIIVECMDTILIGDKSSSSFYHGGAQIKTRSNITIRGCSFTNYTTGISLGGSNNKISQNKLWDNGRGIFVFYSNNNSIEDNFIFNNTYAGIDLYGGSRNRIRENELKNNGRGLDLSQSGVENVLVNNTFFNTGFFYYSLPDNIYCEGKQSNYYYEGARGPICDLIIISPEKDKIYTERRVEVKIITPFVEELYYSDNNERDRRICRDCEEKSKKISFQDGEHNLSIKGMLGDNLSYFDSIRFFIDSKNPRISKTWPRRNKFTNGKGFYIKVKEDNLKNITVSFNPEVSLDLNDCIESRGYNECYIDLNLTNYEEEEIEYYFTVEDIANNIAKSKPVLVKVDTTPPVLNNPDSFWYQGAGRQNRYIYFEFNITEKNFDEVSYTYIDSRGRERERRLCSRLKGGSCEKKKLFSKGQNNITINIKDDANNIIQKQINFTII